MKSTARINRIHRELNVHFPSNNDAWWVSNGFGPSDFIILHHGYGGENISPRDIAEHIFRTERSVHRIYDNCNYRTYVRHELLKTAEI